MLISGFAGRVLSIGLMVLGAGGALAQTYPNKPIRILTTAPGGGADFGARLVAQGMTSSLGQQVIVDNRAAGVIAIETTAKAAPDGYTLLYYSNVMWTLPLMQRMSYDPVKDFLPVTLTNVTPNILVATPSLAVESVKDLVALAKAKPGELNYASSQSGTSTHLAAELFKSMAGVNIVRIPYKSTAPALNDLMGGRVQLMFPTPAAASPHVKAGRLKALAVTSAQPSALVPDLPTIAASGLPGYESATIYGVFTPAGASAKLVNRLNQEIVRIVNQADVKEKFLNSGVESIGSSPQQFAGTIKSEMTRLGKVIKDAGIRAD